MISRWTDIGDSSSLDSGRTLSIVYVNRGDALQSPPRSRMRRSRGEECGLEIATRCVCRRSSRGPLQSGRPQKLRVPGPDGATPLSHPPQEEPGLWGGWMVEGTVGVAFGYHSPTASCLGPRTSPQICAAPPMANTPRPLSTMTARNGMNLEGRRCETFSSSSAAVEKDKTEGRPTATRLDAQR